MCHENKTTAPPVGKHSIDLRFRTSYRHSLHKSCCTDCHPPLSRQQLTSSRTNTQCSTPRQRMCTHYRTSHTSPASFPSCSTYSPSTFGLPDYPSHSHTTRNPRQQPAGWGLSARHCGRATSGARLRTSATRRPCTGPSTRRVERARSPLSGRCRRNTLCSTACRSRGTRRRRSRISRSSCRRRRWISLGGHDPRGARPSKIRSRSHRLVECRLGQLVLMLALWVSGLRWVLRSERMWLMSSA